MQLINELLLLLEEQETVDEAARAFKRQGNKIVQAFRCTAGKRKGKVVSDYSACFKRKDPARARTARMTARKTKFARARKTKLTKRRPASKMLAKMNKRASKK